MLIKQINFTKNQLISNDFYLGYYIHNWNPMINYFLLGSYKKVNIFNLNITLTFLKKIFKILVQTFSKKGKLWLVNEKFYLFNRVLQFVLLKNKYSNYFCFNIKWPKGLLSNFKHVIYVKNYNFPHVVFTPNVENNNYVMNECYIFKVPTFGIVDSKENPLNILYPIPGNSKSLKSVLFIYLLFFKAVWYGNQLNKKKFLKLINKKLKILKKKYIKKKIYKKKIKKNFYLIFHNIIKILHLYVYNYMYKIYLYVFCINKSTKFKLNLIVKILKKYKQFEKFKLLFKNYKKYYLKNKKIKKLYNIPVFVKNKLNFIIILQYLIYKFNILHKSIFSFAIKKKHKHFFFIYKYFVFFYVQLNKISNNLYK